MIVLSIYFFFPENLVQVFCSPAQAVIGSPFAALSRHTCSPQGDEGPQSWARDKVGTGGHRHTAVDTTSFPKYHKHVCVSYLSKTAPGPPYRPVLASKLCCARSKEEGPRTGARQLPLQHSWGLNTSHLGHTAGGNLDLPHGTLLSVYHRYLI